MGDGEDQRLAAWKDLRQQVLQFTLRDVRRGDHFGFTASGGGDPPQSKLRSRKNNRVVRSPRRAEYRGRFADHGRGTVPVRWRLFQRACAPERYPAPIGREEWAVAA